MSLMAMFIQAVAPLPQPQDLPPTAPLTVSPGQAINQIQKGSIFSDRSLTLTYVILTFGLIALTLLFFLARHKNDIHCALREFELRIFTITILVFGSLLVAAAGFGSDQLTPLIGFFGTIAGYILGRGDRSDAHKDKEPNKSA